MSIKFRCPKCGHGLKVPDTAAGRGVRCGQCQAKVKVPSPQARKKKTKEPVATSSHGDSTSELFANIDLKKLEDTKVQLCPKCAAELPEGETACEVCGYDPEELIPSRQARRKRAAKGMDPSAYYSSVWGDSLSFMLSHKLLAFKTGLILFFSLIVAATCGFFLIWVATSPPFYFWLLLTSIAVLVPIGWLFSLHVKLIEHTYFKKEKLGKVHFDFAACGMNGIKFLAWLFVYGFPFWIIFGGLGVLMQFYGVTYGQVIGFSFALVGILMVTPQSLSHMPMVIEQPGWLFNKVAPSFSLTFQASLLWFFLAVVVNLPVIIGFGTAAAVGGEGLQKFVSIRLEQSEIRKAKLKTDELGTQAPEAFKKLASQEPPQLNWSAIILPSFIGIFSCFLVGFSSLFVGRANGLFTLHLRKALNLITMAPEKKYVRKEIEEKVRTRKTTKPAPPMLRLGAFFIDFIVISIINGSFLGIIYFTIFTVGVDLTSVLVLTIVSGILNLIGLFMSAGYFISQESGMEQGTPGKQALSLFVCDENVQPIGFAQALGRYAAWVLVSSLLTFHIGNLLALVRKDGRALHDLITGTQVRMDKPKPKPKKDDAGD